MSLDWRIKNVVDARNLLRDVYLALPDDSPADKALRAASLATEIAWEELEQCPGRYSFAFDEQESQG